jgi:hypothetical protein
MVYFGELNFGRELRSFKNFFALRVISDLRSGWGTFAGSFLSLPMLQPLLVQLLKGLMDLVPKLNLASAFASLPP